MRILAIESSCDETAAAVVENGRIVRSSVIATARDAFARSGGVIPEDAARRQLACILPVVHQALKEATVAPDDLDAIAVTRGPGLAGSLLVGTTCARTLAWLWKKPLIGVHHTLGHLASSWLLPAGAEADHDLQPAAVPIIVLSASGGHTDLWHLTGPVTGTLLGRTRDDAAGEAFDKGARLLGLPYPGGPAIGNVAATGNPSAYAFPHPLHDEDTLDYSFSGLKTALRYLLRDIGIEPETLAEDDPRLPDVAASYQDALCQHLMDRLLRAAERFPDIREVHVVGGVSANARLRALLTEALPRHTLRFPVTLAYCTDNAAMIGAAAAFLWKEHGDAALEPFTTEASLALEQAL